MTEIDFERVDALIRMAIDEDVRTGDATSIAVIPDDLMIIGCDNLPIAAHYTPALSSVRLHRHEIGRIAVEKLQQQMKEEEYIEKEIVKCKLIIRETS